ncbi:hypothetical protein KY495_09795 [Massilia sp. PAMC28688]|uniref:DUF6708 domain-containing protein n=1 Tax=Massilia sp. PAMC28688 TaxID=2861283 RepID=UPI001C62EBB7|nr:DUF6708 domain-containing protein [Massilia sp. PAMC28688]QYF95411.1 hypothetical protein KY495_09795 [Massilia sp. PAMC28688]
MDFAGIFGGFPANRALPESDKSHRLLQKNRLDVSPHYQLSVIEMNSTYLESVDKWYGFRGFITMVALVPIIMFIAFSVGMVNVTLNRTSGGEDDAFVLIFVACLGLPFVAAAIWLMRRDSFVYTHYPIRFNRVTRTVHVFRRDGSVLTVPWNKVFFTLALAAPASQAWNIMGHVMNKDGNTVQETFFLSVSDSGTPDGLHLLRSHWEFVRRYMEEGPQSVTGQVQFCLPIARQRESFMFGVHRLMANSSTTALYLWPIMLMSMAFDLLVVPFRFIAMRTSKIPQWPKEVTAGSAVEAGDPYAIEGDRKGTRRAVFPEAAAAAGVRFVAPPAPPKSS